MKKILFLGWDLADYKTLACMKRFALMLPPPYF